jgi:DNA-binding MarR family transcriptional regulator
MTDADYEQLYQFRARLRRFLRWSEERIRAAGLTPSQYLLLLGIRADATGKGPTIGDMAEFLQLRHHTVVELVDRAEGAGLIRRVSDPDDGRVVRLSLTSPGKQSLERLASMNFQELSRLELITRALDTVTDQG